MLRTVRATRYVTPLREGGSLPAIVEADDLGLYVLKFRGAGQGALALVAELLAGEIARALDLPVPELVFVEVDSALGRNEPDSEIRELLRASVGLNLALDYLPGSVMFDPAAGDRVEPDLASRVVWFDALVTNVDRTAHNPNLLYWHKALYLIDHGAALYFQHNWHQNWLNPDEMTSTRFAVVRKHVLLPWASNVAAADVALRPRVTQDLLADLTAILPEEWLGAISAPETPQEKRRRYVEFFVRRLKAADIFVEEAMRARAELV